MEFEPCSAEVRLAEELRARLETAEGDHRIESVYSCEFALGHPGPHHSLVQSRDDWDLDVWVRWSDGTLPEAVGLTPCDAENADEGLCIFPGGHPGPHSDASTTWS
jgi:hypothetical protein